MPITLITGLPGHGKSLHAIRMMREDYQDRKKYAYNFPDLDYDGLNCEELDPARWTECESGSVLFFDEAWEIFEARSSHKMPPQAVKELARHRHYGLDIILIAQGPFQLDAHVRALVDTHLHIKRPFGMGFYVVRTFQGIERHPDDKKASDRTADTSKRYKFDKRLFGYYKSSNVHTIKRKIPLKLIIGVVVLLFAAGAIINLVLWGSDFMGRSKLVSNAKPVLGLGESAVLEAAGIGERDLHLSQFDQLFEDQKTEYFLAEKHQVDGAPWTSAKYAEVMAPRTFPKPHCVIVHEGAGDRCFCLSQQGTRMKVDQKLCFDLAVNGFFDPTIDEDKEHQRQLKLAERYGEQQAFERLKQSESVQVGAGQNKTTLPYILERIRDHTQTYRRASGK